MYIQRFREQYLQYSKKTKSKNQKINLFSYTSLKAAADRTVELPSITDFFDLNTKSQERILEEG